MSEVASARSTHAVTRAHALVLVADSRRRTRLLTALKADGHEVAAAKGGSDAAPLLMSTTQRPDVIVLDMRLSAEEGVKFAEAYRRVPSPRPEIVLVPAEDAATESRLGTHDGVSAAAMELLRARVRRVVAARQTIHPRSKRGFQVAAGAVAALFAVILGSFITAAPIAAGSVPGG